MVRESREACATSLLGALFFFFLFFFFFGLFSFFFSFRFEKWKEKAQRQREGSCSNLGMLKSPTEKHILSPAVLVFTWVVVQHIFSCLVIQVYRVAAVCFVVLAVIFMCVYRSKTLEVFRRAKIRRKVDEVLGGRTLNYALDLNFFFTVGGRTLNYFLYCCLPSLFNSLHIPCRERISLWMFCKFTIWFWRKFFSF